MFKAGCSSLVAEGISSACASVSIALLLLLQSASVAAAEASPDADAAILYEQVMAKLSAPDTTLTAPARTSVAIYLGHNGASKWQVVDARLAIDGIEQPALSFSPGAARILRSSAGRQVLARLPAVDRELPVTMVVRLAAVAGGAESSTTDEYEASLGFTIEPEQADGAAARVIEVLVDGGLVDAPALTRLERRAREAKPHASGMIGEMLAWSSARGQRDSSYLAGGDDDPALAHARFLRLVGTADAAEIALRLAARDAGGETAMPASWWYEQLRCALALGDLDRAERLADTLQARVGAKAPLLAIERLAVAEQALTAGELKRAERLLGLARPALPKARQQELRDVQGRLLLAETRNAEAIAAFAAGSQNDEAWDYMNRSQPAVVASAYRRFNLAVAMLRNGDEARGLSWLDLLGRSRSGDAELLALRDRANVEMGWHFLQARRGLSALGVLGRVPQEGPYSERAMLGMGWAFLAPRERGPARPALASGPGDRADVAALPAPLKASLLRLRVLVPELNDGPETLRFEVDRSPKRVEEALRAAIAIWQPLAARALETATVIEARLAIAYAQDQLGDQLQARATYQQVVDALVREEQALSTHRDGIVSGLLHEAPDAADTGVAIVDADAVRQQRDIALHRLNLAIDDSAQGLQDLLEQQARWRRMKLALAAPAVAASSSESAAGDDAGAGPEGERADLGPRVDAVLAQLQLAIDARAIQLLDARLQKTRAYRSRALFSLARVQDDPGIGRRLSLACVRQSCP